jgi:hypothetical protein
MEIYGRLSAANVFFAANVIPWNELRGVNRDIRSFAALTEFPE